MKMKTYLPFCGLVVVTFISVRLLAATINSQIPFLNAEAILANWESSYTGIRTMRVSYCTRLVDYQPPAQKPDINMTDLVKYQHVQRVEDGKRYHMRFSKAEDGFNRPESLTEYAFNGNTTQEYFGSTRHGSIFTGLEGSYAETINDLKDYMLLRSRLTTLTDIKAEYPNGAPELSITFKKGMTRGIIAVRPNLESIAGELCHVVEVTLPGKDHKGIPRQIKQLFWMAHEKGMCLMKHQEYRDDRLDREIEVKQIAMTDMAGTGIWYPVKVYRTIFDEEIGTTKYELTVTDFVPNVDVDENTFQFDFPPGTDVYDRVSGLSYVVEGVGPNGEVSPVHNVEPVEDTRAAEETTERKLDLAESAPEGKPERKEDESEGLTNEGQDRMPVDTVPDKDKILGIKTLSILGVIVLTAFGLLFWYKRSANS